MARFAFKLPDLGEGTVESEIVQWRVQPGDMVDAEQPLVDMMTDKATVELTSPVSGKVVSLAGNPGDTIAVGSELVVFETGNAAATDSPGKPTPQPVAPEARTPAREQSRSGSSPRTSPAVRRRAREHGVDLADVTPAGADGRIRHEDLDRHLSGAGTPETPASKPAARDGRREIPVIGLRRKIAERMAESKRHIPHFTYVEEVDVTELFALRDHLNGAHGDSRGKLSILPFLVRALARALPDFPQCNAHYDDGKNIITQFDAVHLGVAAQTPNGLMVPVVRNAESLDMWACAAEIRRLAEAARTGKATLAELSGSTITITSLGALGGVVSTPVINYPEVAIVGINKAVERPVIRDGMIVPRRMMNLSSSFDHRVVDGYDAASFIQALKALLEHPATLFL